MLFTASNHFKDTFGEVCLLILSVWMIYRIFRALKSGEIYTRGRYEFKGHLYDKESEPYMYWQTIIKWALGLVALWTVFYFVKHFWSSDLNESKAALGRNVRLLILIIAVISAVYLVTNNLAKINTILHKRPILFSVLTVLFCLFMAFNIGMIILIIFG